MCGICGFLEAGGFPADAARARVQAMSRRLVHRGPDAGGHWLDAGVGVALGHRRLAVVELGPGGAQPMLSRSRRYVLSFNGEIYNHDVLRKEVAAHLPPGCGHSDSGVLLAAVDLWGLEQALRRCVGMFALAIWDRKSRELLLARDRIGEKPLFYGVRGRALLFGSELKALWAHPAWTGTIDPDALAAYLQLRYVPAPRSIFRGIRKLPPGHWVAIRADRLSQPLPTPTPYWDARARRQAMLAQRIDDEDAALAALEDTLGSAVRRQMLADVPLGVLLSGGLDSSAIAALMQEHSTGAIRTFTIGFREPGFNEAEHAAAIARHLGSEHTELSVGPQEALAVIPELPGIWDEPLSDNSQIPTLLVSRLARQGVTVALTGDGGDELFCGYRRYLQGARLWQRLRRIPRPLRAALAGGLELVPHSVLRGLLAPLGRGGGARALVDQLKDRAPALAARNLPDFHRLLIADWQQDALPLVERPRDTGLQQVPSDPDHGLDVRETMMLLDLTGWLPGDVLVKVDRAAMAASLETRAPFLDHQVVELAWRLPIGVKYRAGRGKWILRELLRRRLPPELMTRPKQGFNIPTAAWLRGPLRDWGESLLRGESATLDGRIDIAPVRHLWRLHQSCRIDAGDRLWNLLTLIAWWRAYRQRAGEDLAQSGPSPGNGSDMRSAALGGTSG